MTSSFAKSVTSDLNLTNNMFQRVLSFCSAEMLTLRKLTRFWVLVVLLSSICQAGYLLAIGLPLPLGLGGVLWFLGNSRKWHAVTWNRSRRYKVCSTARSEKHASRLEWIRNLRAQRWKCFCEDCVSAKNVIKMGGNLCWCDSMDI